LMGAIVVTVAVSFPVKDSRIFHTCLASAWRNNKKAGHHSNAIKESGKLLS